MSIFTIRQERSADYDEVYKLVHRAFATASYSDGTEADYLNEVRTKDTFIPELSFVAEDDDEIIGQIVLYKTLIMTKNDMVESLLLSPISVHPDYFRKGIAGAMVEYALDRAVDLDYLAVFLCGEQEIYQKFDFRPSYEFDVYHKNDPQAKWCMGKELIYGSLDHISGVIDIV